VGKYWFGQLAESVIEREFGDTEGAKSVRFSHGDFNFVVEALDDAAGKLLLGLEVVENQLAVGAEHFGDCFHGLDAGAHGVLTPNIEVQASPSGGMVIPEAMEVFFEQIGANSLQIVAEQIFEPEPLFGGEIGGAF
jgi:hypothetical protein